MNSGADSGDGEKIKFERGQYLFAASYALWLLTAVAGIGFAFGRAGFGPALMIAIAAFWCGMLVGFVFAIPKLVVRPNGGENGTAVPAVTAVPVNLALDRRSTRYLPNTNLTDISDWLTKIIVGLGLVNLSKVPGAVQSLGAESAKAFGPNPPAPALVNATLVASFVIGVFIGYLTTRVFWSPHFAAADDATAESGGGKSDDAPADPDRSAPRAKDAATGSAPAGGSFVPDGPKALPNAQRSDPPPASV